MSQQTLAFIGGGNMARALVGGLLARGWPAAAIAIADPSPAQRQTLKTAFPGVAVHADNAQAAGGAGVWLLAVKPQEMAQVVRGLAPVAAAVNPVVVSVAAGITTGAIGAWLGAHATVVRAMPNRPALVGAGVTALYAARGADAGARATAERVLEAVGKVVWVESEAQIDAVTAVSGSGPAYVFRLIELIEAAAIEQGLPAGVARTLAVETAYGAAKLARESGAPPAVLREEVTSKGGTTAAALAVFEAADLRAIVSRAVAAAAARSAELAREFGSGA